MWGDGEVVGAVLRMWVCIAAREQHTRVLGCLQYRALPTSGASPSSLGTYPRGRQSGGRERLSHTITSKSAGSQQIKGAPLHHHTTTTTPSVPGSESLYQLF